MYMWWPLHWEHLVSTRFLIKCLVTSYVCTLLQGWSGCAFRGAILVDLCRNQWSFEPLLPFYGSPTSLLSLTSDPRNEQGIFLLMTATHWIHCNPSRWLLCENHNIGTLGCSNPLSCPMLWVAVTWLADELILLTSIWTFNPIKWMVTVCLVNMICRMIWVS